MAELFKVNAPVRKPLFEGVQGENEARSIQFDVTPWVEELGDGAVTATAKRSQDSQPYPVTVTKDGTTVTWKPTSTDTAFAGVGSFQLEYTVDDVLAKTCIWSTMVAPSLDPAGDPPDPYDNWLAEMRQVAADALQSEQNAEDSAEDAEAWAKGTKNGTPVSSSDAQYQNNAKYWAELNAGDHAELVDIRIGADGATYPSAGDAVRGQVGNPRNNKAELPTVGEEAQFTAEIGIINKTNLSVYSEGSSYGGRYASIPVSAGEKYQISGYSVNNNFCGAFGVVSGGTSAFYPPFIDGYGVSFTDLEITIPNTVATLYVNGNVSHPVSIKKISHLEQATFDAQFNKINAPAMYAYVDSDSNLYFKKKSITTKKDVCIKMGHSPIGNNLYSFLDMYDKNNTGELSKDFTPESGGSTLSMSQSDWVSPYIVRSVSNPDGDHPSSDYFTGGNHRSNNSSVGGGKTATETSLTILIDGFVPTVGNVYPCSCIDVFTTNLINGYNTSKDDGTGRNIISDNIHFYITAEKVEVKRTIIPLESVVINRCYGLQVYFPDATVSFVGGENRVPFAINTNQNSGNKNTRDVIVSEDFEIRSGIYPTDIGSFNYNNAAFSYFSSGNKVYSNVIFNNALEFSANEKYYCNGYYTFN